MRQDKLQKHGNRIWICLLWVTMLTGLLLASLVGNTGSSSVTAVGATAPDPAFQVPPRPWTALGSTGTVDESALSLYASVSTEIGFRPGAVGKILIARYNVTNTFDNNANPNQPGWRTLEMGSNAPNSVIIEAKLFQVKACQPAQELICTARNRSNDHPCATCQISVPIDFTNNLYYVEVTLNRTAVPAALPRMFTLRIF
ncbi:MAG TPA: hypothetical protein VNS63_04175 [Blastocatellia bacterium]|nr:hypothetical protein [Blastocatellia bacterium]